MYENEIVTDNYVPECGTHHPFMVIIGEPKTGYCMKCHKITKLRKTGRQVIKFQAFRATKKEVK